MSTGYYPENALPSVEAFSAKNESHTIKKKKIKPMKVILLPIEAI
jgi:hypothetical protein